MSVSKGYKCLPDQTHVISLSIVHWSLSDLEDLGSMLSHILLKKSKSTSLRHALQMRQWPQGVFGG